MRYAIGMTTEIQLNSVNKIEFIISEDADGDRLDRYLAEQLPMYSREYLKRIIQDGGVTLSEKTLKPAYTLSENDLIQIIIPDVVPLKLIPEDIPIEIVYEDDDLLIVNKPSGMLTHPTGRESTGTLVNALLYRCEGRLSHINGVERPGIVHRLDRETSGLLVVAKTDVSHRHLQEQLQARTLKREYRAIAQGLFNEKTGTVFASIGRNPKNRDKMAVIHTGRMATTHWAVEEEIVNKFTYLHLRLETGRTHQIRVHMAHIGHPLVGDVLYGTGFEKQHKPLQHGQLLQSFRIQFNHPVTGKVIAEEIVPDDKFTKGLEYIRGL